MMPIAARALDLVLFDLLAFFGIIFILSSSREGRSSSGFRSRPKMDLSFDPQPPPPTPPGELRRLLCPKPAPANETRAARSNGSSNAPRVFVDAGRSIQNVSEISQLSQPRPQFLCSPKPRFERPEGASH